MAQLRRGLVYRFACSIPDHDSEELIITGGYHTLKTVSVYSEAGWTSSCLWQYQYFSIIQ